ncbi:MAG TPA: thioesterase family protein [Aquihabitans sp.]|nr:thioesterase family protein [Aquihabitans sp.]
MTELLTGPATDFDRTTALVPIEGRDGAFAVDLDAGWSSLVGIHGGYLCAVAVTGAERFVPGRSVRTTTTSFLRIGRPGPAELVLTGVRQGRSFSTVVADVVQRGRILVTSRLTLADERSGTEWAEQRPLDLPPPEACVPFVPPLEQLRNFARFELRFDPARLPFDVDRARTTGYVRPLEPRPVDAAWLAMASDAFPPPAFARLEPPAGGVSVDLTTHVHRTGPALAEGEWLVGDFEIRNSAGGLAVEHGRITDTSGTLLAESFQTRLVTA